MTANASRADGGPGRGILLWWVAAFIAHRAVVLTCGFDRVFYWEEAYRLVVAEALLHGWKIPLLDLQADPYAGGSLVVSALAVPLVAVLGSSVVALKGLAVAIAAVGLVAWLHLVDRHFGRAAAHVFALCFVLAPPLFVTYNLIAMGSHAEVVTLGGVQCLLAYSYIYGDRHSPRMLWWWAVVAGLSVWFTYASIVVFGVCVAAALAAGTLPPRRWPVLVAGFLGGFSPWIIYNVQSGGSGLHVVVETFSSPAAGGTGGMGRFAVRLAALLRHGIPAALGFGDVSLSTPEGTLTISGARLGAIYLLLFGTAWIASLWACVASRVRAPAMTIAGSLRARPELPILMLFPLFVVIIAASNQIFDPLLNRASRVPFLTYRTLVPALPAVYVTLGLATSRLVPALRRTVVLALVMLGVIGSVQLVRTGAAERPRIEREARALGATAMGHVLYYKHGPDVPLLAARIAAMSEDLRAAAYGGVGFSLAYHYPEDAPLAGFVEKVLAVDPRYRADVLDGIRVALGPGMKQVPPVEPSARTQAMLDAVEALEVGRGGGRP